ncbi:unnamed protein product [Lymnaea stagnalis]|uniref:Uncharacterized protein n=1 Tax=Lymnaea stagnalis TaxID=6523 RepID=A0AAV2I8E9_LYMST
MIITLFTVLLRPRKDFLTYSSTECGMTELQTKNVAGYCQSSSQDMNTEERAGSFPVSPELIQIKAVSEDEVRRRIDAFIRSKRCEVDERNIREFISPVLAESETSCARTEAVYIHREGEKSHISLKKVENTYGPQTRLSANEDSTFKKYLRVPLDVQRAEAVEERLANMEAHLNTKSGTNDIFARIKSLEQRISFLEGVSPEYFKNGIPKTNRTSKLSSSNCESQFGENQKDHDSLSEIDSRILQLKQALRQKAQYNNVYPG